MVSFKMFLPEPLRARFKATCALQGKGMNEVLVALVEQWLEANETKKTKQQD